MKKIIFILGIIVASCLTFQSCKQNNEKIQADVERALQSNHANISSSVKDGTVTLTGTVESQSEKDLVENTVRAVKNVKNVVNNITVKEPAPQMPTVNADDAILSSITTKLNQSGYKDVKVEVKNGEVTLSGDLSRKDLNKVMQIANEANPAKVTNKLNLK